MNLSTVVGSTQGSQKARNGPDLTRSSRQICVFGVLTALSPFIRGPPHRSDSQFEGIGQMHDPADGRQVHGRMTSVACVLYRVRTTVA